MVQKITTVDQDERWRQFRKRPVIVSAVQMDVPFEVETLKGMMKGDPGDWLIEGMWGELYPCRDNIFRMIYEEVQDDT